ncbi:class I SAM-dependent DNA methyltransferase [Aureimonas leprariae]|uniref:Methyltransferase domain-containing protein n=1 Tax=Plantimonas leprariae TaxID=2615207 RepID=A0A7V7TVB9_9HYPH|nr:methyltransferase domain-containing protein [Aureimonas leprariae]KAB0677995.1 methyltransferase domain-containing protein [Aureimonas leprariae]
MVGRALSSGDPIADRRADYAKAYADGGDHAAAADLMRQALELAPGWAAGWNALGEYLEQSGEPGAAAEALSRAAALDPADASGAGARLAAMGRAPAPAALPPAFVATLFDQYAERFEAHLTRKLAYRAPDLLLRAIRNAAPDRRFEAALDLGCGTGLMGEKLRSSCERLDGVDLSSAMLAKARAKNLYDALREGDILGYKAEPGSLDLVAAADVLNYLGELAPVFAQCAAWLRPGGLLAFTVEAHGGSEPFVLAETMRYRHSGEAVAALLAGAGFAIRACERVSLREDRGAAVAGLVVVAERT